MNLSMKQKQNHGHREWIGDSQKGGVEEGRIGSLELSAAN